MTDIPRRCISRHSKPEFSVEEQRSSVVFINPLLRSVKQITVDGCIYKDQDGKRCDHLINVDELSTSVFVELKGSDIGAAVLQIKETQERLREHVNRRIFWIISYSGKPALSPTAQIQISKVANQLRVRLRVVPSPYYYPVDISHEDLASNPS